MHVDLTAALTLAIALASFAGGVLLPRRDHAKAARRAIEQKAADLALENALRNQDVDRRLAELVRTGERQERRIARLERLTHTQPKGTNR